MHSILKILFTVSFLVLVLFALIAGVLYYDDATFDERPATTAYGMSVLKRWGKEAKARNGDKDAALDVAFFYKIDAEDESEAFYWFKLAAKNGSFEAKDFLETQYDKNGKPK